jgi:hypothetical protein
MMDNWLLSIFMILGVLMFVKKLPDFLKETLALDGSGMFKGYLNPFKKIEDETLGGKAIAGLAKKPVGAVTGIAAGTAAGVAGLATGQGFHLSHLSKGLAGGLKGEKFGKNFASSYGAGKERHKQLQQMDADGVSRGEVFREKVGSAFGRETKSDIAKRTSETYKAVQDAYNSYAASLAGTDAIAKEMDKRIKAAHEAGNYAEETRWTNAFDARLKQVSQNGGKISFGSALPTGTTLEDFIDDNGKFVDKKGTGKASLNDLMDTSPDKLTVNEALNNYASRMEKLIKHLNATASDVAGYSKIDESFVSDPTNANYNLKVAMGKAKGVQSDIDSNAVNVHNQDISKYTGGGKK